MADLSAQIAEAQKNGYSPAEITSYLAQSHPELAPKIKEAQSAGYAPDEIVGHLATMAPQQKTATGFAKNVVSSALNNGGGLAHALFHPLDTLNALGNTIEGAGDNYIPGYAKLKQAMGVAPDAINREQATADAVGQNYKGRYGSLQAAGNTLYKDPVGAVMDVATVADPALKAVALGADAAKLGKVAEVANAARALPGQAVSAVTGKVAPALQGSADASRTKAYYDLINPTTKANKATVQNVVAPGLAERGVKASNLEDLKATAQQHLSDLNEKLNDTYDAKAARGATQSVWPILNKLEDYKQSVMAGPNKDVVLDPALVKHVNDLQNTVLSLGAEYPDGNIPLGELRNLRQVYDQKLANVNAHALAPDDFSRVEATKVLPDAIRSAIAENHPDLAAVNKDYSFWKNVKDTTDATIQRRVGQRTPLTNQIGMVAGEMLGSHIGEAVGGGKIGEIVGGGAGAVIGRQLSRITNAPVWKFVSADAKQAVASALQAGDQSRALAIANRAALTAARGELAANNVPAGQLQ